ncbi:maleylpyruvate isomerase N-terminal domain-containing protein [Actinoplanes sp. NPDC051494]|uniref:maleylpyruvate isomerase N-terminal domain-containing protein n=1 Tax=Actinoplanes sp. NPDC051494 TaxID=3363907 RepID=UPI0037AF0338
MDPIDLIDDRATAFRTAVAAADLGARVPGCPDWTVRDLVAHLGRVHRFWAAAIKAGPSDSPPPEDAIGPVSPLTTDAVGWAGKKSGGAPAMDAAGWAGEEAGGAPTTDAAGSAGEKFGGAPAMDAAGWAGEEAGGAPMTDAAGPPTAKAGGPPTAKAGGPAAGDLLAWSEASTGLLLAALRAADPGDGCWTWWGASGAPMTVGAVARHQVMRRPCTPTTPRLPAVTRSRSRRPSRSTAFPSSCRWASAR